MNSFDLFDPSKRSNHWGHISGQLYIADAFSFAHELSLLISQNYDEEDDLVSLFEKKLDPVEYISKNAKDLPLPSELDTETMELIPVSDRDAMDDMQSWDDPGSLFVERFKESINWNKSILYFEIEEHGVEIYSKQGKIELVVPEAEQLLEIAKLLYDWMPIEQAAKYLKSDTSVIRLAAELKLE